MIEIGRPVFSNADCRLIEPDASDTRMFPELKGFYLERAVKSANRAAKGIWWRLRFRNFGSKSSIARPASIMGAKWIDIGSHVFIWSGSRIEALETVGHEPSLRIGDRTVIQPFVHIAAVDSVEIGAGVLMASYVYITDHDHDFSNPDEPIVSQRKVIARKVVIGNNVWLGERVTVLKGVAIGDNSVIGAGSIVTHSIPPYSVAIGCPARVIREYDPAAGRWVKTKKS